MNTHPVFVVSASDILEHASRPIYTREDAELEVSEYSSACQIPLTQNEQAELVNAVMDDIQSSEDEGDYCIHRNVSLGVCLDCGAVIDFFTYCLSHKGDV